MLSTIVIKFVLLTDLFKPFLEYFQADF